MNETHGDVDGHTISVNPKAIDARIVVWPLFASFQIEYVAKGLVLEQNKNETGKVNPDVKPLF